MPRKFKTVFVSAKDSRKYLEKALEFIAEADRCHTERFVDWAREILAP